MESAPLLDGVVGKEIPKYRPKRCEGCFAPLMVLFLVLWTIIFMAGDGQHTVWKITENLLKNYITKRRGCLINTDLYPPEARREASNGYLTLPYIRGTIDNVGNHQYYLMLGSINFRQSSDYWYSNIQSGGKFLQQSYYGKPDNYVYYQNRHKNKVENYEVTRKHIGVISKEPYCQEGFMFRNGTRVCNYITFRTKTGYVVREDFTAGLVVTQTPIIEDVVQDIGWPAVTIPRMLGALAHLGRLEYFCNKGHMRSWKRYPLRQRFGAISKLQERNMGGEEDWLRPQTRNLTDQCVPPLYTENFPRDPGGISTTNWNIVNAQGRNLLKAIFTDAVVTFPTNIKRAAEVVVTSVSNSVTSMVGWVGDALWGCLYALLALLSCGVTILIAWKLTWLLIKRKCGKKGGYKTFNKTI